MTISDVLETCSKPGQWLLQYESQPMGWRSVKDLADFAHMADRPQLLLRGLIDQDWSLARIAHAVWMIRKSTSDVDLKLRVVLTKHWHDDREVIDIEALMAAYWRPEWESAIA